MSVSLRKQCGVHGHLAIDCFSRGGNRYDLVDEEGPRDKLETNGGGGDGGGAMRGVHREVGFFFVGGRGGG